jgi:predicted  nucleic acid-binding Zn-ribbon protein
MEHGINLDQEFRILVVTDFDPHGYKIQSAAKEHLERAGIRRVVIERVYLNPEHITPGIIERFAVPYEVEKSKASTTKSACSLYNWFGSRTGGIYKRAGAWVPFARNGDGTHHVPQLTTGNEGYELYRVELDNFREDVLIALLIDALERVIDGAEYYYAAAKKLWRETIKRMAIDAAQALIQQAVWAKIQPVKRALDDLRDRLTARWDALTAEEQTLLDRVREDYDAQYESIQEDIDDLQEQINELRERQETLGRQQWALLETSDDVMAFLRAVRQAVVPDIPAAQQILDPVDVQLRTYREAQEEAQTEAVVNRFTVEPTVIERVVNCASHASTVFQRARAGAETFTAELAYEERSRVTSGARNNLEAQQEAMTVEVPDLPEETVEDIEQRIRDANALLSQAARTGELSVEWQELRTHLVDHYLNDDLDWDPWDDWDDGGWQS